jgi:hypothetical protein
MATVPARFIAWKAIDFDSEILECLGYSVEVSGVKVYPPSIGVFSLLELVDSMFVKKFMEATEMDFWRALFITDKRKQALECVAESHKKIKENVFSSDDPATWTRLDRAVMEYKKNKSAEFEDMLTLHEILLKNTFNGYEMIPENTRDIQPYMPYLFGAESIAGAVKLAGKLNCSMEDAVWNVPLVLFGHIAASEARFNGVKGVNRPKDPTDIKAKLKEAEDREIAGELHPWQIEEPAFYPLESSQLDKKTDIQEKYNKALYAWHEKQQALKNG